MNAKLLVVMLVALSASVHAWPKISCKDWTCSDGWSQKRGVPPENIACLGGVCSNRMCCNPPTCALFAAPACVLKANAPAIQCRGEVLSGCTRELCCQSGVVPTAAPTAFVPECVRNVIYFTNFLHAERVNSIDVSVDDFGVQPVGSPVVISRPGGADGLLVNPQDDTQLFVGGQQPRLFVVDTTNSDPSANYWRQTASMNLFNVVAQTNEFVLGFSLDGSRTISRHRIVGGTLPNLVAGDLLTVGGYAINVSAVIPIPGDKYLYTSSSNGGELSGVGYITFDAYPLTTATTAAPFLSVNAHSGTYDPFTNTLFFWGSKVVSQYMLDGTHLGSFDATNLIGQGGSTGFRHFDNGVVDGKGRLYVAANNGMLAWFDFRTSMRIATADNSGSFRVTTGDGLDAITYPVCRYN